jgi:hypothetical protein
VREVAGDVRGELGQQAVIVYSSPPGGLIPAPELRHHLRSRQPERMVPGAFAHLERLPVTAHGKLYRAELPESCAEAAHLQQRHPDRHASSAAWRWAGRGATTPPASVPASAAGASAALGGASIATVPKPQRRAAHHLGRGAGDGGLPGPRPGAAARPARS